MYICQLAPPYQGSHFGHTCHIWPGHPSCTQPRWSSAPNVPKDMTKACSTSEPSKNKVVTTGKDAEEVPSNAVQGSTPAWTRGSQVRSLQLALCSCNIQYSPVTNQNALASFFFNFNSASCPRSRFSLAVQVG